MLYFWSHEPLAPWQTDAWLAQMRQITRPIQYIRQFENRFVTSENTFITLEAWDRCIHPQLGAPPADRSLPIYVGVDGSVKRDSSAIVAVAYDRKTQRVHLIFYRIFQPSQTEPLDFEATIEATLLDLAKRFRIRKIRYDPYQLASVMQRLEKQGLPVEEYPQTLDRLTAMSQQLYDLIQGQGFVGFPSEAMRLAISRTVAVENARGWRITKEKASHKIDVVVALAMACHAAVQAQGEGPQIWSTPYTPGLFQASDMGAANHGAAEFAEMQKQQVKKNGTCLHCGSPIPKMQTVSPMLFCSARCADMARGAA